MAHSCRWSSRLKGENSRDLSSNGSGEQRIAIPGCGREAAAGKHSPEPHRLKGAALPRFKTTFVIAISTVLVLTVVATQSAQAQTFTVIHNFTGGLDGGYPWAGLTMDEAGNLYGTAGYTGTAGCGGDGCGTVYQLKHKGSGWVFNLLYSFTGGSDGGNPYARVIFGPDGALYGTTRYGNGTVFNLKPGPTACKTALCPWTVTVLHQFAGYPSDGSDPYSGDLFLDQSGNIYGTTEYGGRNQCGRFGAGCGTVYELTPSGSGWTESRLYNFLDDGSGTNPTAGVTMDKAGNLYGTTELRRNGFFPGNGTVFQLMPFGKEKLLHSFQGGSDGSKPFAGVIFDQSGNLYGATQQFGDGGGWYSFRAVAQPGWQLDV